MACRCSLRTYHCRHRQWADHPDVIGDSLMQLQLHKAHSAGKAFSLTTLSTPRLDSAVPAAVDESLDLTDLQPDRHAADAQSADSVPLRLRIGLLLAIILPFLGIFGAIAATWGHGFRWVDLVLLVGMYVVTAMGIGLGYHRLFTHRSFETIGVIRFLAAVCGSMAVQGPVLNWVSTHRRHHHHSDDVQDPHSPHAFGTGKWAIIRGWWHSHMGWFFEPDAFNITGYVRDLQGDRMLRFVNATFLFWVALGMILPAVIGGLASGTWTGALLGFLWGGLVRLFLVHHVTWSINSVCHLWGSRPYRSDDHSRNNAIFGILAFGEGWHNNHHAFPTSARHGLAWWQIDLNYITIRAMALVGLAWKVRLPASQAVMAKRIQPPQSEPIC